MMVRNAASTSARSGRSDVVWGRLSRSRACTLEVIELLPHPLCANALLNGLLDARRDERFPSAMSTLGQKRTFGHRVVLKRNSRLLEFGRSAAALQPCF